MEQSLSNAERAVAHTANYMTHALLVLVACLQKNGALLPDQYRSELKASVERDAFNPDRIDHQFCQYLLKCLEGGPRPQPPNLTVIQGGKTQPPT